MLHKDYLYHQVNIGQRLADKQYYDEIIEQ
jgi:hypothetical protein